MRSFAHIYFSSTFQPNPTFTIVSTKTTITSYSRSHHRITTKNAPQWSALSVLASSASRASMGRSPSSFSDRTPLLQPDQLQVQQRRARRKSVTHPVLSTTESGRSLLMLPLFRRTHFSLCRPPPSRTCSCRLLSSQSPQRNRFQPLQNPTNLQPTLTQKFQVSQLLRLPLPTCSVTT